MKTCTKCHESKPESAFYRKAAARDGRQPACKVCHNKMSADWRERNGEHVASTKNAWIDANLDKVRAYRRDEVKRERKLYPERARANRLVQYHVKAGHIPTARSQICSVCGVTQASDWHHHNGYSAEHKLDVVPVCRTCHVSIHNK